MTRPAAAPEVHEVVVDLGGRSFAEGTHWRLVVGIVLMVVVAWCMASVRDAHRWRDRLTFVLGAATAAGLLTPVAATVTEIDGPRQELQASAIMDRSGYTFLAGRHHLDSGYPFQDEPVVVERDSTVRYCRLSSWRLHRKAGEWQTQLSTNWRYNTRTQKLRLTCPDPG
ncbi:hypothetical protein [Nocardia neocaledoniensis]|uniref:hypothetical protein n=1 Tax=Nocardia neocaledoniensis TaxID=236511 RepID=UPI002456A06B|nr:hypothetical protein [Nocardia neocaledoniensis]